MKAELLNYFGDDLMVINAARVSYGKEKQAFDAKDEKLLKYLVEHKHIAPFRHPQLQFRIECPIFVERQLFKHQVGMCLSGDSEISFIDSSGGIKLIKLKELFARWTNGRPHQPSKKDAEYSRKRISNRKIRVLNEDSGIFEYGKIKNIFSSGKKILFQITLENGKTLKCSKDHRIFTDKGYETISTTLKIGSNVACNGTNIVGTGLYRDKEYMKSLREDGFSVEEMAKVCGCSYHNIRKWLKIHNLSFSKKETYFKNGHRPWNYGKGGYSLNISEEMREKKSILSKLHNKKGKESKWWKGGITNERGLIGQWTRLIATEVHKKYNFTCQKCGISSGRLHAHHIIPVVQDIEKAYDKENLITVCNLCQLKIHSSLESEMEFARAVLAENFIPFEYSKRIGKRKKFTKKVKFSKIVSIKEVGEEETYDIEIDHEFHNFVANGIVVHNSANSISGRYVDFSDNYFNVKELRKQSKSSKQGSEGVLDRPDLIQKIKKHTEESAILYAELCESGVAKEQARIILPLSLETQFIWTGSLLAFIHFWQLRIKPDTQQETRELALQMLDLVKNINKNPFKYTLEAFNL